MYERDAAAPAPGDPPADAVEEVEAVQVVEGAEALAAAHLAIWRLFQEGYVDENMATAGLLAIDLGTRRIRRATGSGHTPPPGRARAGDSGARTKGPLSERLAAEWAAARRA